MEKIEIRKVSDYIKYIEDITKNYTRFLKLLFRGESKVTYDLLPSVYRKIKTEELIHPDTGKIHPIYNNLYLNNSREFDIIQDFMFEAASKISAISINDVKDRMRWLEYAQHFGVPTRLLDWTLNPLIALYFACKSEEGEGKVYILRASHYSQITRPKNMTYIEGKTINDCISNAIWEKTTCFPYPILTHPHYFDQRMIAQSSCFMVWGDIKDPLTDIINDLEKERLGRIWYEEANEDGSLSFIDKEDTSLLSLYIPEEKKLSLLRELDILNINQSTVFPGLDGIGQTIEWRKRFQMSDLYDTSWPINT